MCMSMKKMSMSCSNGLPAPDHDRRVYLTENVDKERLSWNTHLIYKPIEKAYEELFGEALKEYNEKQKRKDRKIANYLEHIREYKNSQEKRPKECYEYVLQLGNQETNPCFELNDKGEKVVTELSEASIKIYKEYVEQFEKNNPNFYLIGADIHMDERTPHLHIRLVPFANSYKRGMKRQNGLVKALNEMGYITNRRDSFAISDWRNEQMEQLNKIANKYGIEREIVGNTDRHRDCYTYKEICREAENNRDVIVQETYLAKEKLMIANNRLRELEDIEQKKEKEIQEEEKQLKRIEYQKDSAKKMSEIYKKSKEDNKRRCEIYEEKVKKYEARIKKLEEEANIIENDYIEKKMEIFRVEESLKENKNVLTHLKKFVSIYADNITKYMNEVFNYKSISFMENLFSAQMKEYREILKDEKMLDEEQIYQIEVEMEKSYKKILSNETKAYKAFKVSKMH